MGIKKFGKKYKVVISIIGVVLLPLTICVGLLYSLYETVLIGIIIVCDEEK